MKKFNALVATIGLIAATSTFAVEATRFEVPMASTTSRAAVQSEAHRASDAGEIRQGEFGYRFSVPMASQTTRAKVQAEAVRADAAQTYEERAMAGNLTIGGM